MRDDREVGKYYDTAVFRFEPERLEKHCPIECADVESSTD